MSKPIVPVPLKNPIKGLTHYTTDGRGNYYLMKSDGSGRVYVNNSYPSIIPQIESEYKGSQKMASSLDAMSKTAVTPAQRQPFNQSQGTQEPPPSNAGSSYYAQPRGNSVWANPRPPAERTVVPKQEEIDRIGNERPVIGPNNRPSSPVTIPPASSTGGSTAPRTGGGASPVAPAAGGTGGQAWYKGNDPILKDPNNIRRIAQGTGIQDFNPANPDHVKKMQNWLIQSGYDVGKTGADGKLGQNTLNGLNKYIGTQAASDVPTPVAGRPAGQVSVSSPMSDNQMMADPGYQQSIARATAQRGGTPGVITPSVASGPNYEGGWVPSQNTAEADKTTPQQNKKRKKGLAGMSQERKGRKA